MKGNRVNGNPQVSDAGDLGNLVDGACRGEGRRKADGFSHNNFEITHKFNCCLSYVSAFGKGLQLPLL